ncbi:MAG: hypothetical protein ACLQNE_17780 [Thermoguttaceae bacterium]
MRSSGGLKRRAPRGSISAKRPTITPWLSRPYGRIAITAVSYGRMAVLFPSAGSAYTYVGRGLNTHLGFLAGWAMVLDYLIRAQL